MSGKHTSRHGPSPSSPALSSSKLSKFLPKTNRDRSKSVNESLSGSMSSPEFAPSPVLALASKRRSSKRDKGKDRERERESIEEQDETPVIVEPVSIPRPRTRSERPVSEMGPSSNNGQYGYSTVASSSPSRAGDIPSRLSGWFAHTFSSSSTDLSLPSLLSSHNSGYTSASTPSPSSPSRARLGGGASALLTAAKHGKGHLDKAVRYLMDSDSTPDKSTEPIWLLGVQHPGYEPPPPPSAMPPPAPGSGHRRRGSLDSRRVRGSSSSIRSYESSSESLSQSQPPSAAKQQHPGTNWPPVFYADFTSRVWLTYRSQFPGIKDGRLADLCGPDNSSSTGSNISNTPSAMRKWPWGGEKEWTSDSGWGCMLRTGQSLLANALVHVHLGRDWRKPMYPSRTAEYATYVEIITWFFDTPSPEAPFSVHRMALAGKELGTDVGQWFGPSIAAGAIKSLSEAYPEAGIGVSIASDGQLFQSDVFAASHGRKRYPQSRGGAVSAWGDKPVLLLLGVRLGLNGVNPIYYDTIKMIYTFPQSVGIAGGRPSSSYYFVGSQGDNLFYLDPHHARPAIPLHQPPPGPAPHERKLRRPNAPTSPSSSVRTGSSAFSYHAPSSPSPLQHESSRTSSPGVMSESEFGEPSGELLDPVQEHYVSAYSSAELGTFHCDRVRKMPLNSLDPSMLIGFLCRDEQDWKDFRARVQHLPKAVFSVQDEPPKWPEDSDDSMGLESMSIAMSDDMVVDDREFEEEDENSTEDDPVGPLTPGPGSNSSNSKFHEQQDQSSKFPVVDDREDEDASDDIADDWIETPVLVSPGGSPSPSPMPVKQTRGGSGKKTKHQKPVPVPRVSFPSDSERSAGSSYAFPSINPADGDAAVPPGSDLSANTKRMHTARGRDGGRTQSGGVKGVFTED